MSPDVTRSPARLPNDAGIRIDPPVSSPMPTVAKFAATPATVPALEPPGSRARSYGFRVTPLLEENENQEVAKSGSVVFAMITAPASRSRAATAASSAGW